ncbi:MAG: hypothetical protein AB7O59_16030 [Pirellulales bacterium]
MELASKGLAQFVALYKSLTPSARIATALLLGATIVSLGYLAQHPLGATHVHLLAGEQFSPAELRQMQAAFGKAGLEAEVEGARIRIPRGQESKYMAALDDAGALPAESGQYLRQALGGNGLLRMPQRQQQAAWLVAKQQELQGIIGDLPGVERAAVQIDESQSDAWPRPKKVITAAVFVFPRERRPLAMESVRTIRQSLVSSISGLESAAVTVVDMSTAQHFTGADDGTAPGDYAAEKKRQELAWKHSIGEVLSFIPGVLVSTSVQLTQTSAGVAPDAAPARVTASVAVPATYYQSLWRQEHSAPFGQAQPEPDAASLAVLETRESKKIEELVSNLLPRNTDADPTPRVAVSTFQPVVGQHHVAQEMGGHAWSWLVANRQTVSLGALALVGLAVLRSMFRAIAPKPQAAASVAGLPPTLSLVSDVYEEGLTEPVAEAMHPAPHRPSLRGELADAVRDDPDAAVSVLRSWIGNAS